MTSTTTANDLGSIFTTTNLLRAWEHVAMKNAAPGIDGVTVEAFSRNHTQRLGRLRESVLVGHYEPQAYIVFQKEKRNGGIRELVNATVVDKVVARTAATELVRRYDRSFEPQSYAYRPGRGALKAVSAVERHCSKASHAVRADILAFFDEMDHAILRGLLQQLGESDATVDLLIRCVDAARFDGVEKRQPHRGVPQGSPLAPVLSNIYLHPLDSALNEGHFCFARYADDLLILTGDADHANGALARIQEVLCELKLRLSIDKTRVYPMDQGFPFLGFLFSRGGKTPCREACARVSRRLGEEPYNDESETEYQSRLATIRRGWKNYFGEEPEVTDTTGHVDTAEDELVCDGSAIETMTESPASAETGPVSGPNSQRSSRTPPLQERPIKGRMPEGAMSSAAEPEQTGPGTTALTPPLADDDDSALDPQASGTDRLTARPAVDPVQPVPGADASPRCTAEAPCTEDLEPVIALRDSGRYGDAISHCRRLLNREDLDLTDADRRAVLRLLAELYEQQGLPGAARRCRGAAGDRPGKEPTDGVVPLPHNVRMVEHWLHWFGHGTGHVTRQYVDALGRHGYRPASKTLNAEYLRDHWAGRHTLAVPVFGKDNSVAFAVLDLDVTRRVQSTLTGSELKAKRIELLDDALGLADVAHRAGVEGVIEDSGCKGYHVWFFPRNPVSAKLARHFLAELCRVAGDPPEGTHRELFPGADTCPPDGNGTRIKLPLGIHRLTGNRCGFINPDGSACTPMEEQQMVRGRNDAGRLRNAIATWTRWRSSGRAASANEEDAQDSGKRAGDSQALADVVAGCAVLRALRQKAQETHDLSHHERTVLRGILAPLGSAGHAELHRVIRPCRNYDRRLTDRMISSAGPKPLGCQRIREILGEFADEVGCTCRFKPRKGEYAHPLRHVGQSTTGSTGPLPEEGGALLPRTGKATAHEDVRPPVLNSQAIRMEGGRPRELDKATGPEGGGPQRSGRSATAGDAAENRSKAAPAPKPKQDEHTHDASPKDDGISALLHEYHSRRTDLLGLQRQLQDACDRAGELVLPFGTLRSAGPDPDLLHWTVTL